jgi:tape measure domain-containing protein
MQGINIPIGGDMAPFLAVVAELKGAMQDLSSAIRGTLAPAAKAANDTSRSMMNAATGATRAKSSFQGLFGSVSDAGMGIANIAAGAKAIRSAFRFLSGLSGSWRTVAKAAIAAAAAVAGVVLAAKLAGAAFRTLLGVARGVWTGIKSGFTSAASAVKGAFSGITSAIPGGGMLGPLAGIAGIAASLALVTTQLKGAFSAAAAFEDLEVSVSSFLGSTKAAADLLGELQEFADKTPFATRDIQEAAGALLGAGVRGNVAGITKDIAAVSKSGQSLKELADALGKGFAKGKFQTEELNKFLERGINLLPALEQQTGRAGKELTKLIEAGLGFETVTAAIASMSREGGSFFGLLERRSQTFTGLASTLSSVWETVRRTFAQPILDALKPILQDAIGLVGTFKEQAEKAGKSIGNVILSTFAAFKQGKFLEFAGASLKLGFLKAVNALATNLQAAIAASMKAFEISGVLLAIDATFTGIGMRLRAMLQEATADFMEGIGRFGVAKDMRDRAGESTTAAGQAAEIAKQALASFKLETTVLAFQKEFKKRLAALPDIIDTKSARAELEKIMVLIKAETEALRRRAAVSGPSEGATGETNSGPVTGLGEAVKTAVGQAMTLTTSLGRVGGGGFGRTFLPMVSETKKSNQYLSRIEKGIYGLQGGMVSAIV